jgi:hypothetical protein
MQRVRTVDEAARAHIQHARNVFEEWLREYHPNFVMSGDLISFLTLLWEMEYEETHETLLNIYQSQYDVDDHARVEQELLGAWFSIDRMINYSIFIKERYEENSEAMSYEHHRQRVMKLSQHYKEGNLQLLNNLKILYSDIFGSQWEKKFEKARLQVNEFEELFLKYWETYVFSRDFNPEPYTYHNLIPDAETKWPKAWGDVDGKFK